MNAGRFHLVRERYGQGLVEFALVLPVFLFILFGLIDTGRYVYLNAVLSQAAREGARVASVEAGWIGSTDPSCGTTNGPVCPATATALKADIVAAANRMTAPFAVLVDANVSARCDAAGSTPPNTWPGSLTCTTNGAGNLVSVRVTETFSLITPLASGIIGNLTPAAATTMVIN